MVFVAIVYKLCGICVFFMFLTFLMYFVNVLGISCMSRVFCVFYMMKAKANNTPEQSQNSKITYRYVVFTFVRMCIASYASFIYMKRI